MKPNFKTSVLGMQGNLLSFALKLTLDKDQAKDLVQDTTLKALNNEEKYVENTNFKGWMMTIMRNIFINNYRKAVKENASVDLSEDLYTINQAQGTSIQSPDGAYTCREITAILERFPEDHRKPFSLYVAGYRYDEIAKTLGMPLGTVKCRIFYTRKRLREILKDYRD